jgi:hypothetical protein
VEIISTLTSTNFDRVFFLGRKAEKIKLWNPHFEKRMVEKTPTNQK